MDGWMDWVGGLYITERIFWFLGWTACIELG